jgi:Ca2+-binding RTX toxin-like protein
MATIRERGDAPAGLSTEEAMGVGDLFEGTLASRQDADWVRVPVEAGQGYAFFLQGDGTPDGIDGATVSVRNALGVHLDGGSAQVGVSVASVSPSSDGIVYAAVSPHIFGSTGLYRLSVVREIAEGLGTTTKLAVGDILRSAIDFRRDSDWVRVDLEAGRGYVVRVEGDGTVEGISTTSVDLRDALGAPIDAYRSQSSIVRAITPAEDQAIYVDIGDSFIGGNVGTYVLSVTPEIGAGLATGAGIALGETVRGRIDFSGDADWFRFDAVAGQSYVAETLGDGSATSLGSHFLRFHDPRGETVAGGYGTQNASGSMEFTAEETGAHYVAISAGSAGRAGLGYELTLSRLAIEGDEAVGDTLQGTEGDDLISGFGGDDWLRGHGGDDVLDGGQGVDFLEGGAGDDVLIVSDARDVVRGGPGSDVVLSPVSYALADGTGVERLEATGAAPVRLSGSTASETLVGNRASNVVAGLGGEDVATGGAGRDIFVLSADGGSGRMTVTDFGRGDRIAIDDRLLELGAAEIAPRAITAGEASTLLAQGLVAYVPREGLMAIRPDDPDLPDVALRLGPGAELGLSDVLLF